MPSSIKSRIVTALVNHASLERLHNEYLLQEYCTAHRRTAYSRRSPGLWLSYDEFVKELQRVGATSAEITQWNEGWQQLVSSCEKRAKMRSLNEVSIERILQSKLQGTGIKYHMLKQQYRVALTLTMSHNMQATFYIQHSRFREQLDQILPTVQQLNQLMDTLGQAIKMRTTDKHLSWQEC